MKLRTMLRAGGILALVTAASFWLGSWGDTPAEAANPPATGEASVETSTVTRRTLQQQEAFEATIGYGEAFGLPGSAQGTVTWVPDAGTILRPGDPLYRADEQPTYWARGDVPMYRTLQRGSEGADVAQLQRFLQDGGYLADDAEIDGEFDGVLRSAVRKWQDDHGLDVTGAVDATQLLFLPYDAIRVALVPRVGDSAQDGVLQATSPDLFVSAEVSARKKRAFESDPTIEVELADGSRYSATVQSIEAVETQDSFGEQKFRIVLQLDAPAGQQPGDVTVEVIDVLAEDVLTIPVRALAALVEGGYAVEVVLPDGSHEYHRVEIGEFADGWVEISGEVNEGDQIVVPS